MVLVSRESAGHWLRVAGALLVLALSAGTARAAQAPELRPIADAFAGSAVTRGEAAGIAVAIITPGRPTRHFAYGQAIAGTGTTPPVAFTPGTLFRIGSVTKVFTTNLLGQWIEQGKLRLGRSLARFRREIGALQPLTVQITLRELGAFVGGIADFPPLCTDNPVPGCLPVRLPTLQQYSVQDFLAFFRSTVPTDYRVDPPVAVSELPAPYFYSNYSVGLIGLLIGGKPGSPLDNSAVQGWFDKLERRLLRPLGLKHTFLFLPPRRTEAAGYLPAIAHADVSDTGGRIIGATLISRGAGYGAPPAVVIVGGGGTGATATASVKNGRVDGITIGAEGSGYLPPPTVSFGAVCTKAPVGQVTVGDGKVTGVVMLDRGIGCTEAPEVTITGGRPLDVGSDAVLAAELVNGGVAFVEVVDPGAGYVDPLSVIIEQGAPTDFPVTASAASGFLRTSLRDLSAFAEAALGRREVGGRRVPRKITRAFEIAQRSQACYGPEPALATCPPTQTRSALAWAVEPADPASGVAAIVSKDGEVPGYSTFIALMPDEDLGVVVMMNAEGGPVGPIAHGILFSLLHACAGKGGCIAGE